MNIKTKKSNDEIFENLNKNKKKNNNKNAACIFLL